MVIGADDLDRQGAAEFPCLHRTAEGRVLHCPELRRLVVEWRGAFLVLRTEEYQALHRFLRHVRECRFACARMARGDLLRLRDARGEPTLILDQAALAALTDLLTAGARRLDGPEDPDREPQTPRS